MFNWKLELVYQFNNNVKKKTLSVLIIIIIIIIFFVHFKTFNMSGANKLVSKN
jgi:hypothetical protein